MIGKCNTNHCQWHITGKPTWWTGPFFLAGCRMCEAKAEKDPSIRTAPSPEECFEQYKAKQRKAGQRKSVVKRQKKARAAMVAEWRETMPRRECA